MELAEGQVAVITGGASGIGYGLAEELGRRGLRLVVADIRAAAAEAAAESLRAAGHEAVAVQTDVTEPAAVQHLADATMQQYGRVDLICNNAGAVIDPAPMWELDVRVWQRQIDVKLMAVVHGVRSFVPLLLRRGAGHVLNTASSGGLMPLPSMTPYNATMHAVVGLTESLNLELRQISPELGATVLCPGLVATDLLENSSALGFTAPPTDATPDFSSFGEVLTPQQVATQAMAAIENDQAHVIPGAGIHDLVRARAQSVIDDLYARQ